MRTRIVAGALLVLSTVAACGSGSSREVVKARSAGAVRASRIAVFACPAGRVPGGAQISIPADALTKVRLCPLMTVQRTGVAVTLTPADPAFARVVQSLTLPDQKVAPGTPCAAYADLPQLVIGRTSSGAALLHIPVDGCGHYLRQPLAALTAARSR